MRRALPVWFAALVLGCGGAISSTGTNNHGARAPNANEPALTASRCADDALVADGQCVSLAGSAWELTTHMPEGTRVFLVELHPGGRCTSHDPADTTDDDEWASEAKALRFWFNQRYVVYEAVLDGPTSMHGVTHNVTGLSWSWSAVRVR